MITIENLTPEELGRILTDLENRLEELEQRVIYLEKPELKGIPDRPPINERLDT